MDRLTSSGSIPIGGQGAIARRTPQLTPAATPEQASTLSATTIPTDTMVRQARQPEPPSVATIRAAEFRLANAYREDPIEFARTLAALSLEELATTVTNV